MCTLSDCAYVYDQFYFQEYIPNFEENGYTRFEFIWGMKIEVSVLIWRVLIPSYTSMQCMRPLYYAELPLYSTVEPLYRGHHWDPAGPSCIQWNLSIEDTIGTQLAVLYTVEPLYRGHHWDPAGPSCIQWNLSIEGTIGTQLAVLYRGVSNSEVDLYTALCSWDCRQCPH